MSDELNHSLPKKKSEGSLSRKKWKNLFRRKDASDRHEDKDESEEEVRQSDDHPLARPRRSLAPIPEIDITHSEAEQKSPRVKPQFGLPPSELKARYPEEPVPGILMACIEILEKDIRKEGMFRIPGRMTSIVEMKDSYEQGKGLGTEEVETLDIAGLVAQFFRELPEPLLTYELYYNWIDAAKKTTEEGINEGLKGVLQQLDQPNFEILQYFIKFLTLVNSNSGANRMGAKNLGLVFGASLLNPPSIDQYDLTNIKLQCVVVEQMITHYSYIFEGTESAQPTRSRSRTVATIPAGAPQAAATAPVPTPQERRKGFMKRKSTFFLTTHVSGSSGGNRIQAVVSLVNKDPDIICQTDRDSISQADSNGCNSPRSGKKKSDKKKHKKEGSIA